MLSRWTAAALVAGSALVAAISPVAQVVAAPAISVFVGYADSDRSGGEFPNPWNGGAGVTFDACSPQAACTFDGGAIRVRNDGTTSVSVDSLSVHIGSCLYTWSGSAYPVSLAVGAALITAQRGFGIAAGCTGPEPTTFDSSDIPGTGICTNDGILPVVDVTVDGTTSSFVDSGQVLNTGGIDPAGCSGSDESTQWTRIGSRPCPGQTLSLVPAAQSAFAGTTATVTATLTDGCGGPLDDVSVGFKIATGPNAGRTGSGVTDTSGNATFTYSSSVTGTDTLHATVTNAVGFTRTSNPASVTWILEFAPGGGSFVIGNQNAAVGAGVYFWGAQWAKRNSLSGGPAPRSFKGYADLPSTPACGEAWSSEPGNSTPPPDGPLPQLMAVIVTGSSRQTGPEISGDIAAIVVVQTKPGYAPNPGHPAFGTVVGVICGAVLATATTTSTTRSAPPPAKRSSSSAGASMKPPSPAPATCQVSARGKAVTLPQQACPRRSS